MKFQKDMEKVLRKRTRKSQMRRLSRKCWYIVAFVSLLSSLYQFSRCRYQDEGDDENKRREAEKKVEEEAAKVDKVFSFFFFSFYYGCLSLRSLCPSCKVGR